MTRAASVVLAAALALFAATGCSDEPDPKRPPPASVEEPNARVFHVHVDGRNVPCILVDPPKSAVAITCDWSAK